MTRRTRGAPGTLAASVALALSGTTALAVPQQSSTRELKRLSLEELMSVEITSVSRTEESLQSAAAAIAIVSNEDIERSGATSIPEALRLVPGLHIARRNSSYWAMSARGFSSSNSEKLLVLSDSRSLYTPLFSGVLWDAQEYVLEDIDRIEVIRGPGAALWGSNAVNGVINITTKNARDTQGTHLEAALGDEEEVNAAARYGGTIGEDVYFRVFAKHGERDDTFQPRIAGSDDWRLTRAGVRADWDVSAADTVTLLAGAYRGDVGQYTPSVALTGVAGVEGELRTDLTGGNVLARWQHRIDDDSELQVRFYYDRTDRDDPSFEDVLDTYDLDFQHGFRLGSFAAVPHEILWGVNYRFTHNSNTSKSFFALDPSDSDDSVVSAFVQDQMPFGEHVQLTLGSKFGYNEFSGFEVQPSIRAAWDIAASASIWGAVSRAVRVPTRLERDISIDATPNANPVLRLVGNEDFESEELIAYELGVRWQAAPELSFDVAAFHHDYDGLASLELGTPFVDPRDGRTVIPLENRNLTDGDSHGVEALITFIPLSSWRLTASYSYIELSLDPRGMDINRGKLLEGATPRHQWALRSLLDLTGSVQLDAQFRSSSAVRSSQELVTGGIPGYSELDVRVAWRATEQLQLSIVGQNLLHDHHPEFGAPLTRGEIERGVYGKIAWDF